MGWFDYESSGHTLSYMYIDNYILNNIFEKTLKIFVSTNCFDKIIFSFPETLPLKIHLLNKIVINVFHVSLLFWANTFFTFHLKLYISCCKMSFLNRELTTDTMYCHILIISIHCTFVKLWFVIRNTPLFENRNSKWKVVAY